MHAAVARAQRRTRARAAPGPTASFADRSPPAPSRHDRAAEMPVVTSPLRVDRHAERRAERRRVGVHRQRDLELVEPLPGHRQADQPAAVLRHEVDRVAAVTLSAAIVRSPSFSRSSSSTTMIIRPGADGLDGLLDRGERARAGGRPWRCGFLRSSSSLIVSQRPQAVTPGACARTSRHAPWPRTSPPCRIPG